MLPPVEVFSKTCPHLLEDPGGHLVAAVEDDVELLGPLHLLQQRFGVLGLQRQLPDLQPDVVAGRRLDQLLQANQPCREEEEEEERVVVGRHIRWFLVRPLTPNPGRSRTCELTLTLDLVLKNAVVVRANRGGSMWAWLGWSAASNQPVANRSHHLSWTRARELPVTMATREQQVGTAELPESTWSQR